MITTIAEIGTFLVAHGDLIHDLYEALEMGVSKDTLKKTILDAKIAASDAEAKAILDSP